MWQPVFYTENMGMRIATTSLRTGFAMTVESCSGTQKHPVIDRGDTSFTEGVVSHAYQRA